MSEKDSSKRIRLTVEGGPTREFPGDRTFVIGRSQNVDFSIPHPNLSREHVRISLKNGDVWLEDLGSANGTFVQGQRLPSKALVKIKPHYRILLGTASNVVILLEAVDGSDAMPVESPAPKGDVDLEGSNEPTIGAGISRRTEATREQAFVKKPEATSIRERVHEEIREHTKSMTVNNKGGKIELDFPQQHFPQEVKKEKQAELRIIEAKKQRVIEDIQYKEREVEDLRSKIRELREESLKLKEATESYRREIKPLEDRRNDLHAKVQELDLIYEEKIDALETGFQDLKATLEESHTVRMARADKDFKEKTRRLDEEYSRKLHELESGTQAIRQEGDRLREQVMREKKELEESLRKIQGEAESIEAERRLIQVKYDTEITQLQGAKLKLENEVESFRQEKERAKKEYQKLSDSNQSEAAKLEEARRAIEDAIRERESVSRKIAEMKESEEENLSRIQAHCAQIATLEKRAEGIQSMIRQAENDAEKVRAQAKEEAQATRKEVAQQIEAERLAVKKNAEAQAAAQLQALEAQIAARLQATESEIAGKIAAANQQALSLKERSEHEAHAYLERAKAEAEQYLAERKKAGDQLLNDAQARASSVEMSARSNAEKASMDISTQLDQKRRAIEVEIADLRKRADQEIRLVRANALAEIDSAREREAKDFAGRLSRRAKEIGDQIDRIVGAKLSAQFGVNMDPVSLKAFSEEVHSIIESALAPSKNPTAAKEATFTVLPVNTQARDRAALYWKKMGIAASVFFVLLLGRVIFPGMYSSIGQKLGRVFEVKDNTDEVVRRTLRDRQLAMTFVTEQDQQFRNSYTDNILYTEAFIEMKEDIDTQKQWTLELNKFFQGELGLTEKAIVQFGSAEGRMVRELLETRKSIIPARSSAGIQKMREIESGYLKEMKFIVRTDGAWEKFLNYHREYYVKFIQDFSKRAPASVKK